jgi:hypothetical protein
MAMAEMLNYASSHLKSPTKSRRWLKLILVVASTLALIPLGLALLILVSVPGLHGVIGPNGVVGVALLLIAVSILWVTGIVWLYGKLVPPAERS